MHMLGVAPELRRQGIGSRLYETFFETARVHGRSLVHLITAPFNTGSIAFHEALGFELERVLKDFAGPGEDRLALRQAPDVTEALESRLEALARSRGARFFGIADLAPAREEVRRLGGEEVASFPRAVSTGIALSHEIVDRLPERRRREVAAAYRGHIDEVKEALRQIEAELTATLRGEGHSTLAIPVSERKDARYPDAIFSHKLAAHLAGLGWIGKSCLLVTPEVGPRVRWTTVLTDAPLEPAGELGFRALRQLPEVRRDLPGRSFQRSRLSRRRGA